MIELGVLVLAGLGLWMLYERYGNRVERLEGPTHQFRESRERPRSRMPGRTVGHAGSQATAAVETAGDRIADAAKTAGHERGVGLAHGFACLTTGCPTTRSLPSESESCDALVPGWVRPRARQRTHERATDRRGVVRRVPSLLRVE